MKLGGFSFLDQPVQLFFLPDCLAEWRRRSRHTSYSIRLIIHRGVFWGALEVKNLYKNLTWNIGLFLSYILNTFENVHLKCTSKLPIFRFLNTPLRLMHIENVFWFSTDQEPVCRLLRRPSSRHVASSWTEQLSPLAKTLDRSHT